MKSPHQLHYQWLRTSSSMDGVYNSCIITDGSMEPCSLSEDLPAACKQGTDIPAHRGSGEERLATQLCKVLSGKELEALNGSFR